MVVQLCKKIERVQRRKLKELLELKRREHKLREILIKQLRELYLYEILPGACRYITG